MTGLLRSSVALIALGAVLLPGCRGSDRPAAFPEAAADVSRGGSPEPMPMPTVGAVYDLAGAALPDFARLFVQAPQPVGDGSLLRWRWQLLASNGTMPLEWEVDLPAAGASPTDPITRFVVRGDSLSAGRYEDPHGRALLPSLPASEWLPWTPDALSGGWPDSVRVLGRAGRRRAGEVPPTPLPLEPELRVLDPDVLIATARAFKDVGRGPDGDWKWKDLDADDYRGMIAAGFNVFGAGRPGLQNVLEEPVWFHTLEVLWPPLPLHPGFRGATMFADEPAVRTRNEPSFPGLGDSRAVVRLMAERTTEMLDSDGEHGRRYIFANLRKAGVEWGAVPSERVVVWEAIPSAAWYQMEAGADGWIHETRLDARKFADDVKRELGVDFPPGPDATIQLHLALFRGAARHFQRPWGVSIFGQTGRPVADRLFPLAYEAGATYFWFWTSDGAHHVPHDRQLELARELRSYQAAHPRPEGPAARTASSRVAVVLPWGYALDDWSVDGEPARLWAAPRLGLGGAEDGDVPRRAVLRAAMEIAVERIELGQPWDLLFLREGESASGYDEVVRVDRRGRVTRER
jgi:hypothetical protein